MIEQNLTQYVFADGHEEIADQRGRVIAIRDPEFNIEDYLSLNMWPKPRVKGSTPEPFSREVSKTPKIGDYILEARFLWFGQRISNTPIREINEGFVLPA